MWGPGEALGEQLRAHEGCPFRLDVIEDTTKAALSDGGTISTMGSCPDKKTAALGGEDRAAPPGAMAPPQKKRSSHQRHSSQSVVGVLLLALTGLGAAAERPTKPKRRSAVKHSAVAAEPEFMKSVRPAQSFASRVDF